LGFFPEPEKKIPTFENIIFLIFLSPRKKIQKNSGIPGFLKISPGTRNFANPGIFWFFPGGPKKSKFGGLARIFQNSGKVGNSGKKWPDWKILGSGTKFWEGVRIRTFRGFRQKLAGDPKSAKLTPPGRVPGGRCSYQRLINCSRVSHSRGGGRFTVLQVLIFPKTRGRPYEHFLFSPGTRFFSVSGRKKIGFFFNFSLISEKLRKMTNFWFFRDQGKKSKKVTPASFFENFARIWKFWQTGPKNEKSSRPRYFCYVGKFSETWDFFGFLDFFRFLDFFGFLYFFIAQL
jgi:hypothetical protein